LYRLNGTTLRWRLSLQSCLCSTPYLEFRMGLRFNTNTWRTPLQLLHRWLPASCFNLLSRVGWPERNATGSAIGTHSALVGTHATLVPRPCRVRSVRTINPTTGCRTDMRLVISGRISDVCAELDRLADLERRGYRG
jgi:hypothetical protein